MAKLKIDELKRKAYQEQQAGLRLNLGSGYDTAPGWVHVDKLDYGSNIVADVLEGLPFPDNHFDFVLVNHTLQMFTYEELPKVMAEIHRVMKELATIRIITPDLDKAIDAYISGDRDYFPVGDDIEPMIGGKFARYLYWHGDSRCGFTQDGLVDLLWRSGFSFIKLNDFEPCELHTRENESLTVEAKK